jgi:hypothetical protein
LRARSPSKLVWSFRPVFWFGVQIEAPFGGLTWGEFMKLFPKLRTFAVALLMLSCTSASFAQRPGANAVAAKSVPGAYNISDDVSLQGTVLKYTENSQTAPLGTHVLLQTSSGSVDVHLGDARLLHLAKLNITQGTSVRFVGQMSAAGPSTVFLARLVQVGTQIVAVRSDHGLPLALTGSRAKNAQADQKGGAR